MSSSNTEPAGQFPLAPTDASSGVLEVTMPEAGTNSGKARILAWVKRPGETVRPDEPICRVSTDGAIAEIVSPDAGIVRRILVGVGATVEEGHSLAEIETREERAEAAEPEPQPEPEPEPVSVEETEWEPELEWGQEPAPVEMARFRSPAVRRLAAEHGIDLSRVAGSGRGGRITRDDVKRA